MVNDKNLHILGHPQRSGPVGFTSADYALQCMREASYLAAVAPQSTKTPIFRHRLCSSLGSSSDTDLLKAAEGASVACVAQAQAHSAERTGSDTLA